MVISSDSNNSAGGTLLCFLETGTIAREVPEEWFAVGGGGGGSNDGRGVGSGVLGEGM